MLNGSDMTDTSRPAFGDASGPLVFTHIPKTAGTALRQGLMSATGARTCYTGFDRCTMGGFDPSSGVSPSLRPHLVLNPDDLPDDVDMVAGHLATSTTRSRYPDSQHLTVLREARSRVLSLWLFSRAYSDRMLRHWGTYAEYFTAARLPLADYLALPRVAAHTDNAMLRQLLWPHPLIPVDEHIDPTHDDELVAAASSVLQTYDFTAAVEAPDFAESLSAMLGRPISLDRHEHAARLPRTRRVDVIAEVDAATEMLAARTRLDARLWTALAADLDADAVFERTVQRHQQAMQTAPPPPLRNRLADTLWALRHGGGQ